MLIAPFVDPFARIERNASWRRWFAWRPVRAQSGWVWGRVVWRRDRAPAAVFFWNRRSRFCDPARTCRTGSVCGVMCRKGGIACTIT